MTRYQWAALIGTIIMGIGSFMACLAVKSMMINIGNILLLISIIIMIYAYSKWQP